jgi:dihydroxyacid dehydratase/phosphogluconate dehydratase
MVDERVIVNAMVALLATGGSTNHLIHWVAVARAAGILIDWTDFSELSAVTPLLARVYPNGSADVNQFQAAGGPGFVIRELLKCGVMHPDVATVAEAAWRLHAGAEATPRRCAGRTCRRRAATPRWCAAPTRRSAPAAA